MKTLFGADIQIGCNLLNYHTNSNERSKAKKNIDRALKGETVIEESFVGEETQLQNIFRNSTLPHSGTGWQGEGCHNICQGQN